MRKYALISPNEQSYNGARICEISDKKFPVSQPLFWVVCDEKVTLSHYYDLEEKTFKLPHPPKQSDEFIFSFN